MTLSDLASLICLKVRQTDDAAVAACKKFLARRAEMMWQSQLWKDSLQEVSLTLGTDGSSTLTDSVWIPSRGTLLFPADMDSILAVRSSEREMVNEPMATYFRHDPDTLTKSGTPKEFHLLPPAVWEFATASTLYLVPASGETVSARLLTSPDGTSKVISSVALTATGSVSNVLVVWQASKPATTADVPTRTVLDSLTVTGCSVTAANSTYTKTSPTQYQTADLNYSITNVAGTWGLYDFVDTLLATISDANFPDGTWTGIGGVTAPTVAWTGEAFTIPLATTAMPLRQRIRLVELPADSVTLRVLFKSKFPAFTDDNDICPLQSCENALIAFTAADMLQRERQYGKAQALQAEGQTLLNLLIQNETAQQANRPRLIPGEGYGSEVYASSPLTF